MHDERLLDHIGCPYSGTILSLTGLRGVAALWVMGFHYSWAAASAGRDS